MKNIFIALVAFLSFSFTAPLQSEKSVVAMFEGTNDGVFYFVDNNDNTFEFVILDQKILKEYDLQNDENLMDQMFKVVYKITTDEDGIEDYVIVSLAKQ